MPSRKDNQSRTVTTRLRRSSRSGLIRCLASTVGNWYYRLRQKSQTTSSDASHERTTRQNCRGKGNKQSMRPEPAGVDCEGGLWISQTRHGGRTVVLCELGEHELGVAADVAFRWLDLILPQGQRRKVKTQTENDRWLLTAWKSSANVASAHISSSENIRGKNCCSRRCQQAACKSRRNVDLPARQQVTQQPRRRSHELHRVKRLKTGAGLGT
eukprot:2524845-Pleurochrysis_carterae.AAC.1